MKKKSLYKIKIKLSIVYRQGQVRSFVITEALVSDSHRDHAAAGRPRDECGGERGRGGAQVTGAGAGGGTRGAHSLRKHVEMINFHYD